MTNWYSIFYWLTVADGVKQFFDSASTLFSVFAGISLAVFIISFIVASISVSSYGKDDRDYLAALIWRKSAKVVLIISTILSVVMWAGYIFTPSKKDALIIIAGGTVGNFVTQDSSARKIPSEVLGLLRTKIKEEVNESTLKSAMGIDTDTLKDKTKEQLLQIIKSKQ